MNKQEKIAALMKQKRKELGLTQRQVAEKLGYESKTFIYMIEKGTGAARPPVDKIRDFAEVYGGDSEFLKQMIEAFYPAWFSIFKEISA